MPRNKKWWNRLAESERWWVWHFERSKDHSGGPNMPDYTSDCGMCSTYGNQCNCLSKYNKIIKKEKQYVR